MERKPVLALLACLLLVSGPRAQSEAPVPGPTRLAVLGSGTPNPSPTESGCSLAVLAGDSSYLVDFGPGVVRRAAALAPRNGGPFAALEAPALKRAFLTHLHSDHTTGYPDLILTPWVMGRNEPLLVHGPEGLEAMTRHILKAYEADIRYRIYGSEPANDQGWRVECRQITKEGLIYRDKNVSVEAFPVLHGTWPSAWGFRFKTHDRVIVISGDTRPCPKLLEYAKGADILVHEVYYQKGFEARSPEWRAYHAAHHTSTLELGRIAAEARPKLLVLYHVLYWGGSDEQILAEIAAEYDGKVVVGKDLGVY